VYYKEAVGAFVVFDLTRNSSFEAVKRWKEDIDNVRCNANFQNLISFTFLQSSSCSPLLPSNLQKVRLPNGDPLPVVLLANKCDLVKTPLSEEVMNDYCKENGFLAWFATSAKENINIDEAVNFLVENIIVHGSNDAIKGPGPDALKVGGERGGAPDSNACGC
jgi:Ras-related protein Rab-32